ncbi:Wzz/FepE/Etk N-terminal domain-containing protein [Chromobacterium sp. CV08]|uniref:Wzz/FepE/Etk N-terminal domain-containing protein n=1 Tax=Chromobacterium sp. CV08 TaxID=3133274 RepID=UPI003DA8EFD5
MSDSDELRLIDIVLFVRQNWRQLLIVPVVCMALAAALCFWLPNQYQAKAVIMIPAPVGAAGGAGIVQDSGVLGPAVDRFQLQRVFQADSRRMAMLQLSGMVKTTPTKDGLLEIAVTDIDPKRAADLANYVVDRTRQQVLDSHLTEQSRRWYALQQRLAVAQEQLRQTAGAAARLAPDSDGALNGEAEQIIGSFAELEAQMALMDDRAVAASSNLQTAILQLRSELEKANGQIYRMPASQLAALRAWYFNRALVGELQRQITIAKVLASQDVQVVVAAAPPLDRSGPKRVLIVLLAGFAGLGLAAALAAWKMQWRRLRPLLHAHP